jgi:hypothetical protein
LEEIFGFSILDVYYFCSSNIKQNGGISMKKRYVSIMMCTAVVASFLFFITAVPTIAGEKADHPRIVKAIDAIEDAEAYMKAAPHDFGGHKEKAIVDCEKALKQLREALKYREMQDRK